MPLLVVRHAQAGRRSAYQGDDRERPLTARGLARAWGLVEPLSAYRPRRVLSSPFVRCWQTVQPVAQALGLGVESVEELSEGHGEDALQLVLRMAGESAILCTHGDVSTYLLAALDAGSAADGRPIRHLQKGEFWVVQSAGSTVSIVDQVRPLPAEAERPAGDG